jgi:2-keto-4-pentenoate hydratase/2-oxohepta-3-ene-1,7-dioic acid hydratase in catechol pathway
MRLEDIWSAAVGVPSPGKIVCVGLNYRQHAAEGGDKLPSAPLLFGKFANTVCGHDDPIVLPRHSSHVDAEAELAVVIGERCHAVRPGHALDVIAGYTCANDVSARDFQFSDGQWLRAKGYDTFCPLGPEIVPVDELGAAEDLRVRQLLNGEVLQDQSTSELVFDVPALIAYISGVMTLQPGDVICTGTPAGVGYFREPKVALAPGDRVTIEVERVGTLTNTVVAADD